MATNNTDFVTAEGLAKAMSAVGGGISIEELKVVNSGLSYNVIGVDNYRYLMVFFNSYNGTFCTEVSYIPIASIMNDGYMAMCNDGTGASFMSAYYGSGGISFSANDGRSIVVAVFGIR